MTGSRHLRRRSAPNFVLFTFLALIFVSCTQENSFYIQGDRVQKKELRTLFSLLNEYGPTGARPDNLARFATARKIAALLIADEKKALAASFLLDLGDPEDEYAPWYLFSAAAAYESAGDLPLAIPLYERLIKTQPDLLVEGNSLHYQALLRLVRSDAGPERKIEYYRDLIVRFPDAEDIALPIFSWPRNTKISGQWERSDEFLCGLCLPYFATQGPGGIRMLYPTRDSFWNSTPVPRIGPTRAWRNFWRKFERP